MTERGADFDAKREVYEAAREDLARVINNPDIGITATEYRALISIAKRGCQRAHGEMLEAW